MEKTRYEAWPKPTDESDVPRAENSAVCSKCRLNPVRNGQRTCSGCHAKAERVRRMRLQTVDQTAIAKAVSAACVQMGLGEWLAGEIAGNVLARLAGPKIITTREELADAKPGDTIQLERPDRFGYRTERQPSGDALIFPVSRSFKC